MCYSVLIHWTGELQSVDGYMNIALEQTREFVEGKLRRTYGDAFVRGNNGRMFERHGCWTLLTGLVMYISADS